MYDFLFVIIELFFASSYRWNATRQNVSNLAAFRRRWVTLSQDFGEGVVPGEYFLVSTKLDTFCYRTVQNMHRATCSRFDTIPACDRQTDKQTDRIAVASTALAMRALRRAVKLVKQQYVLRLSS